MCVWARVVSCRDASTSVPAQGSSRETMDTFTTIEARVAHCLFGYIAHAKVKSSGQEVALKCIHPKLALRHATSRGEAVAENADTELSVLRLAARHAHPHLMGMHPAAAGLPQCTSSASEAIERGHKLMAVLPWCGRGDLMTALETRGSGLPVADAMRLFAQIASAVHHMHTCLGYCHRDISLENIFLQDDASCEGGVRVLVGDFGAAGEIGHHDAPAVRPGKVSYVAPEIFRREASGYDGVRADVYSLGVVLFCLLAGNMPYNRPTATDECYSVIQRGDMGPLLDAWGLKDQFPPDVLDLVKRMMSPTPSLRPSLLEVLRHPRCAGHVPSVAMATPAATAAGGKEHEVDVDMTSGKCVGAAGAAAAGAGSGSLDDGDMSDVAVLEGSPAA